MMSFRTRAEIVVGLSDFTLTLHKPDEGEKMEQDQREAAAEGKRRSVTTDSSGRGRRGREGRGQDYTSICVQSSHQTINRLK